METSLTIQQVATLTGLSVHTLRYYERNGLLEPVKRAANGHRRYSAQALTQIEFLTRLRLSGMPIRQMQQFAELVRRHPDAIGEHRAILESHEQRVQERLRELSRNLEVIQHKIQLYKELETRHETEHNYVRRQNGALSKLVEQTTPSNK